MAERKEPEEPLAAGVSLTYRATMEARPPATKLDKRAELQRILDQHFDDAYYRSQFPDGYSAVMAPLLHYLTMGWREGRNPNSWFDTAYYLTQNPDVRFSSTHPFIHYLLFGISERRQPNPAGFHPDASVAKADEGAAPGEIDANSSESKDVSGVTDAIRESFDAAWYRRKYPELALSAEEPLRHFVERGWREGKDPAPWFNTRYYLDSNVDVAQARVNPFFHYLVQGEREGRLPSHPAGPRADILRDLQPMSRRIAAWTDGARLDVRTRTHLLQEIARRRMHSRVVFSISHDIYLENVGGIQTCIRREQDVLNRDGVHYLHMSPSLPIPDLADDVCVPYAIAVVLDGEKLGDFDPADVIAAVEDWCTTGTGCAGMIVHHLLGHRTAFLTEFWVAAARPRAYFWIHDFFTVCKGYTLLRNDIVYCGAPSPGSNACGICVYGDGRKQHIAHMEDLFASIPFHAVAPSAFASSFWRKVTDLPVVDEAVVEHCRLTRARKLRRGQELATAESSGERKRPIRVAFAGHPSYHKGWNVFGRLVGVLDSDPRYDFFHLGAAPAGDGSAVSFVQVSNTTISMREALIVNEIDVVVLWSLWPETYNIVAYESLAAGVRIVTNAVAGNIPAMVRKTRGGVILDDEEDLVRAFTSGDVMKSIVAESAHHRRVRGLEFSEMTSTLIMRSVS